MPVEVVYRPKAKSTFESDFARLVIQDGVEEELEVVGRVGETEYSIQPPEILFEDAAVGEKKVMTLTIHNTSNKSSSVYFFDTASLPPQLRLSKSSGRIAAGCSDKILLSFSSREALNFQYDIQLEFRGGQKVKVPVLAEVIIPNVVVFEEELDFGMVTFGNSKELLMNIENTSSITARLRLDLRASGAPEGQPDAYECL